jgi:serine/threonine protein kinase/tetratricopeptide (TPR) repeat protein
MDEASIFLEALQQSTPEQRGAYLDRACAGNDAQRRSVEMLLKAHAKAGEFLNQPAAEPIATRDAPMAEGSATVIGPYKLMELIGEGGMGLVFVAEQQHPVRRKVALKVIKPGMDTRQVIARFEAERQALAMMDHANIAKVHDGGTTPEGRPYFVMELVKGTPITEYCDQNQASVRERLGLFVDVCQAVQHAHQKGIIHRDIKPSNVLVTSHDGKPVVKVIDFGVAKAIGQRLTDKTVYTQFAQLIGTPLYMSPEQAGQSGLDVDTRSDIYSLGVLLYELLTGTTPFDKERLSQVGYDEMRRIIREEEPPKPSMRISTLAQAATTVSTNRKIDSKQLSRLCRGELDWIVMKALEKDRNRRYETASGFAMDVQRYLADEAVQACPPSARYRFRKFVRRNKASVVAGSAILFCLVVGIMGTSAGLVWAVRERDDKAKALIAETKEREAKEKALDAEKQARDRAMAALRTLTDEIVENQMARGTKLTEENKEFLRKTIKQFESFAAIAADDVESRAIRAEGYLRVGRMRDRLGESKEAETAYAAARDLYKGLADDFPDRPEFRQGLARSHNNLGALLLDTGRLKQAEEAFAAALALRSKLAADFPAEHDYRRELAGTHGNQGNLLKRMNRLREAERAYLAALALFKQLVGEFPKRREFRQELALSHDNMGMLLRDMGRGKEAAEAQAAGIAVQEQLVKDFPKRPELRQELANSQFNLGQQLWSTGNVAEAELAWVAASALQKELVAEFSIRPEFRVELARSYNGLGILFASTGRLQKGESSLRAALDLAKQLADDHRTQPDVRRLLVETHGNLGIVFECTGRLKEAEESYAAALALSRQLVAVSPDQLDLRNEHAGALGNMALLHLKKGDFRAAKARLGEALPHNEAVLKANPGNPTYRQFYRNNLGALIWTSAGLGDPAAAKQVAQKLRDVGWDPPRNAYDAACALSRCIPIVQKREKASREERDKQAAFYVDEAMNMLRDAVLKGFKNGAQMKNDTYLAPLREREDFKKLLASLEAGSAKK